MAETNNGGNGRAAFAHGTRVETTDSLDLRGQGGPVLTAGHPGTVRASQISARTAWVDFDGFGSYHAHRDALQFSKQPDRLQRRLRVYDAEAEKVADA